MQVFCMIFFRLWIWALPIPCTVRPLISDKNLDKPLYAFASLTA